MSDHTPEFKTMFNRKSFYLQLYKKKSMSLQSMWARDSPKKPLSTYTDLCVKSLDYISFPYTVLPRYNANIGTLPFFWHYSVGAYVAKQKSVGF